MGAVKILKKSIKAYNSGKIGGGIAQLLKNINRVIYACDISYKISIGDCFKLPHQGLGVVIGPETVIGRNVTIYQNVTIGAKANGENYAVPMIGDNVVIGAGATILGNIKIGNNVYIGANAVVLNDIADNSTAVGVPAKIIKR